MPPLGMVAVPEDRDRLAERRPDVVEVDPRGHHAHDHLECAGLGQLDLLELEGVLGLALALLTDHPRRHRLRELTGLQVELRDLRYVYSHASPLEVWGERRKPRRILTARRIWISASRADVAALQRLAGVPGCRHPACPDRRRRAVRARTGDRAGSAMAIPGRRRSRVVRIRAHALCRVLPGTRPGSGGREPPADRLPRNPAVRRRHRRRWAVVRTGARA